MTQSYGQIITEHLPVGWSWSLTREMSFQLSRMITLYKIISSPDVLGRTVRGSVLVTQENGETYSHWRHAVLKVLCRMDSELVYEIQLVEECPTIDGLTRRDYESFDCCYGIEGEDT